MRLHFIIHERFESPSAIETWAKRKGHPITRTQLYDGDRFSDADEFDFLVVMGGPQSPATTTEECPHFDAEKEISFIKKAIDGGKAVLGVCLGAQLVGEALGAGFGHSPNKEIGVFEVTLTADADEDPVFSTFPKRFPVGHWHGDMPGLTPESKVLAVSEGCPRQVVRYTPRVYGFQCHFEFTPESIEEMIRNCAHELEEDLPYVQSADELRAQDYRQPNDLLCAFLDYVERMVA